MNAGAEALSAAADMVESGWCRHHYATDAIGDMVDPQGPDAKRWCASGAVITAAIRKGVDFAGIRFIESGLDDELAAAGKDAEKRGLDYWNDHVAKDKAEVAGFLRETAVKWREEDRRFPESAP